jgi:tRNA G18 (ribose-2'-O)-methylase SpoU
VSAALDPLSPAVPPHPLPVTAENRWFQLAATLKTNRQKRSREKQFFVEGVRSINALRGSPSWQVTALYYCPGKRLSGWARDVLGDFPDAQRLELSRELMEKLADREEGSEMLALVRMPDLSPRDVRPSGNGCVVVLDRPGNPGNLGSIVRSCDAFGVEGIVMTGHAVDPFDPLVVRASAGAFFSQRIVRVDEHAALEGWLAECSKACADLRVVGTSARAERPVERSDLRGAVVLLFGNETTGLSPWLKSRCHEIVGIPMRGVASSLNLAAALTAVLFERDRQRRVDA